MKTSCFKCYKGKDGVSIARRSPKGINVPEYFQLQPDAITFYAIKNGEIDQIEYEKRYRNITLSLLNPQEVYDTLKNKVLLCWEPSDSFCHRHIVSKWISEKLGIEVPEWKPEDEIKDRPTKLF